LFGIALCLIKLTRSAVFVPTWIGKAVDIFFDRCELRHKATAP
jgi:hypothetical protein